MKKVFLTIVLAIGLVGVITSCTFENETLTEEIEAIDNDEVDDDEI